MDLNFMMAVADIIAVVFAVFFLGCKIAIPILIIVLLVKMIRNKK